MAGRQRDSSFRPGIEGLRAVAVLAVVLFHADVPGLPGGFVGVDVFFVISKPEVFVNGCVRSWRYVGQAECAYGAAASATRVALVGDSHAAMWSTALEQIAARRQWRLETMGKVTCPLLDLPITSPYLDRDYTQCTQWCGQILDRLRRERPALIVVGMSRRYGSDFGFTVYGRQWLDSLTRLVGELRSTGAAVLVLGPIPTRDPSSRPACPNTSTRPPPAAPTAPPR